MIDLDSTGRVPETYAAGNNNFHSFIPRYEKPDQPCEYCRSRQLECFLTFEGQKACSPCSALFRACSFTQTETRAKVVMDTLHVVTEDQCCETGALTGVVALKSWVDPRHEDPDRTTKKTGIRFSRESVRILKDWLDEHSEHPYPTDEEKEELKGRTGLKGAQILNWMANARRRGKVPSRRAASPSLRTTATTEAITIPIGVQTMGQQGKTWEDMNPLERWQESPPEHEPASVTDIAHAVASSQYTDAGPSNLSTSHGVRHKDSSAGSSSFSLLRPPSVTSCETLLTNQSSGSISNSSHNSAWSHGSRNSFGSLGSNAKKDRRRRRRPALRPSHHVSGQTSRPYQCTFCTDTFKSKYDWSRHEKSLHLSLEKWICAPLGDIITCSASGQKQCVYCDALNPTKDHLEAHNHRSCEEKGLQARTFYRKDHLRQHLRLMHGCKLIPSMESWKTESTYIKSRCGFCAQEFAKWQDRIDHIAKHFRDGAQMKDWKGCRGFDAAVAAQITNAMPPYLIANEAKSPLPFSASNQASMAHHHYYYQQYRGPGSDLEAVLPTMDLSSPSTLGQVSTLQSPSNPPQILPVDTAQYPSTSPMTTCWEILTVRLGRFVKERLEQSVLITDDMLQHQARIILYNDEDPWNQTAADNPEWLELFKKAHGLCLDKSDAVDRSEVLEDLGVGVGELSFDHFFDMNAWDAMEMF